MKAQLSITFSCLLSWLLITTSVCVAQDTTLYKTFVKDSVATVQTKTIIEANYIQQKLTFKNSYPFIDYSKNYIEWENYEAIAPFFNKLKNVSSEKIKIVHIGDSHIQADMYPSQIRQKLHETFGTGGRGMVFPYSAARTHAGTDYVTFSRGRWEYAKNVQWMPKYELGLSGMAIHTKDHLANFMLRFKDESLSQSPHILKIYCKKSPQSFDLQLITDGLEETINIDCSTDDGLPYITVQLPAESGEILQFSVVKNNKEQNFFECHGIVIEKVENSGIIYHGAGVNGASFRSLTRQKLLPKHLSELKPDLVVIDLGINDFYPLQNLQQPYFEELIKSFIDTIRQATPQSSILLLSVQEACHRHRGLASTQEFSEMARRIAFEKKCAFYDFYEISGAKNSMQTWQKNGLAKKDFLHLTSEGYQHKGELLANAILNGYHLTLTKPDSLKKFTLKEAQKLDSAYQNMFVAKTIQPEQQETFVYQTDGGNMYETVTKKPNYGKIHHKIKKGESLGSLAVKYHTTISKLQTWNNLKSANIRAGQSLIIYQGNAYEETQMATNKQKITTNNNAILVKNIKQNTEKQAGIKDNSSKTPATYKVKKGDSLWAIAKKYHVSVEKIKSLNSLVTEALNLGQVLKLR
jgi:LysM repeat protein/lysophospholipase L1-like esterase